MVNISGNELTGVSDPSNMFLVIAIIFAIGFIGFIVYSIYNYFN